MTRTHRDELARFMDEYHQRSIIETVFGAIKKMYGNHLRNRRRVAGAIKIRRFSSETYFKSDVEMTDQCGRHYAPGRTRGSNPRHLLQHRVVARSHVKNGRAHARVAHCNGCLAGAVATAPLVGEPAHHPLDQMGILQFRTTFEASNMRKIPVPEIRKMPVPARHQ